MMFRIVKIVLLLLCWGVVVITIQAQPVCEATALPMLNDGETMRGTYDAETPTTAYCLSGQAGDVITVRMNRVDGQIDPFLLVTDITMDIPYALADDAPDSLSNAEIRFVLPETGIYVVVASDARLRNTTGTYELSLTTQTNTRPDETSSSPDSTNDTPCETSPLSLLTQGQWAVNAGEDDNSLIVYRVGCSGYMVYTLLGRTNTQAYEFNDNGDLVFTIAEQTYVTIAATDEGWFLRDEQGAVIHLEPLSADCDANLVGRTWRPVGAPQQTLDFLCDGQVIVLTEDDDAEDGVRVELLPYTFDGAVITVGNQYEFNLFANQLYPR